LNLKVRRAAMASLGGLDLTWPRPVKHHQPAQLPLHLPVLVQAYADTVEIPWVALHGGRLLGTTGRLTPSTGGASFGRSTGSRPTPGWRSSSTSRTGCWKALGPAGAS
jgi:hypothetical protein